ncbi:MAG: hypothetical protein VCD00_15495 [Candidatus Hydrogenedentota bacterium]
MMVIPQHRNKLVYVGGHEGVGVREAFMARPAIEGTELGDFVEWGVIPFSDCVVDVAFGFKVVGNRFGGGGDDGVVARETHRGQRVTSESDRVWISPCHKRCT